MYRQTTFASLDFYYASLVSQPIRGHFILTAMYKREESSDKETRTINIPDLDIQFSFVVWI